MDAFECEVMDWNLFDVLSKQVAKKIKDSNYQIDTIIGLARGGWVLARVLCDLLGVKDLLSLTVEHWGVTATPDGKARLKHLIRTPLSGKKVLVVDDITDTGESMQISVHHVKSLNPEQIKTATLRHIIGSDFIPDFYADEISWRWVIFPWNVTEDLCNIVEKVMSKQDQRNNVQYIKSNLKREFKIEIEEETIKEILKELHRRSMT